ncbi:MAG: 50S ribosomal protein L25 [Bryobacterales bacterium]|nr:50S ribosomal protein L25 [Bryobacterales bacterium]
MSVTVPVAAARRAGRGKNENNRLRAAKRLPAVLYGSKKEPLAISVNPKDIEKIFRSKYTYNTIIELDIEGEIKEPSMMVDWQLDPIRDNIIHVDFKRIDLDKPVAVKLPVNFVGVPFGVKNQGGTLDVVNRHVAVECLPEGIPEALPAEIADMKLGGAIRAGELPLPAGMRLLSPSMLVLAHIAGTRASALAGETAETPAAAAPAAAKAPAAKAAAPAKAADAKAPAKKK